MLHEYDSPPQLAPQTGVQPTDLSQASLAIKDPVEQLNTETTEEPSQPEPPLESIDEKDIKDIIAQSFAPLSEKIDNLEKAISDRQATIEDIIELKKALVGLQKQNSYKAISNRLKTVEKDIGALKEAFAGLKEQIPTIKSQLTQTLEQRFNSLSKQINDYIAIQNQRDQEMLKAFERYKEDISVVSEVAINLEQAIQLIKETQQLTSDRIRVNPTKEEVKIGPGPDSPSRDSTRSEVSPPTSVSKPPGGDSSEKERPDPPSPQSSQMGNGKTKLIVATSVSLATVGVASVSYSIGLSFFSGLELMASTLLTSFVWQFGVIAIFLAVFFLY